MKDAVKKALGIAKGIQAEAPVVYVPPSEGTKSLSQNIIPRSLVRNTRSYIERVTEQINGCYEKGWFDGCSVMMRKLLETLIIESFEAKGISHKITNPATGDFYQLSDLVTKTLSETSWNLCRNSKKALPSLKTIGDLSAHNRRYSARREDIDKISLDYRVVCEELLHIANLKK